MPSQMGGLVPRGSLRSSLSPDLSGRIQMNSLPLNFKRGENGEIISLSFCFEYLPCRSNFPLRKFELPFHRPISRKFIMPGNGNYNGDSFRLGQAPTARKNFFAEQQQQGCKRKYSDEDFNLAGPSTSTGVGDILFSGKRHCSVFNDTMQPSTSMDCDDDAPAMMEEPSILPSTLYSHMVPYAGTPPAPHRNTSRPEFPRAAALAPFYGNLSPAEVARYQNSASTSQDHCRKITDSPGSPFVRGGFCRPGSWEGMVNGPVPIENDYY